VPRHSIPCRRGGWAQQWRPFLRPERLFLQLTEQRQLTEQLTEQRQLTEQLTEQRQQSAELRIGLESAQRALEAATAERACLERRQSEEEVR
jgi:hypothetical protein